MVGGIGSCGRELCCTTFLPRFAPVSIKMAKHQNLVLNPTKVSGQCGRLKCCLVYEDANYVEAARLLPKIGKRVAHARGRGPRRRSRRAARPRARLLPGRPPRFRGKTFTARRLLATGDAPPGVPTHRPANARLARIDVPLLHHDADLLRQRPAPPRHVLHDGGRRRAGALPPRARQGHASSSPASTSTGRRSSASPRERGIPSLLRRDRGEVPGDLAAAWRSPTTIHPHDSQRRDPRHEVIKNHPAAVAEMWQRIAAGKAPNGEPDISRREYEGMYCVGCEDSRPRTRSSSRTAASSARSTARRSSGEGEELLLPALCLRRTTCWAVRHRIRYVPSRAATRCGRSSAAGSRPISISRMNGGELGDPRPRRSRATSSTSGSTRSPTI